MKTLRHNLTRAAGKSSGFTLVEVCISLAIMTVTVVPLLGLMAGGLAQVSSTIDNNQAANIAQQVFVNAQQTSFSTLSASGGYTNYYTSEGDNVTVASPGTGIVYDAVVTCTPTAVTAPTPPLVTVVVTVRKAPGGVDNPNSPNIAKFVGTVSCQDISGYNAKTD